MRTIGVLSALLLLGSGCNAGKKMAAATGESGQTAIGTAGATTPTTGGGSGTTGQTVQPTGHSGGAPGTAVAGNTSAAAGTVAAAAGGAMAAAGSDAAGAPSAQCPSCTIPVNCRGFSFDGIKYSPGGTVLPNKCQPFDATWNNPYALRCIDALPKFKTKFAGDEYCILPPPPDLGIQVGLHPQGNTAAYWKAIWADDYSGYENPPAEWVLMPGAEITQNYRSHDSTNTTDMNYYRTYFRMRSGSHHMIVTMHDSTDADGWIPGIGEALPGLFDPASGTIKGILGGEQRPDDNTPVTFEKPPEDAGLYLLYPANPSIIFNMHHFNITDKPRLREGWINIWWEPDAKQVVTWYMGLEPTQVIGLAVAAGQAADLHYSWSIGTDVRLVRVFGHRHFWTTNFSTWIKRASGETELTYQSYDWFDMPTYRYDSQVKNPPLNPAMKTDGATSGVVMLHAGDELHFNCHIEFTDARQQADPTHAPMPSKLGTLGFANEAYTGEMCIQFGNVTGGGSIGLPSIDSSPVPDFTKLTK